MTVAERTTTRLSDPVDLLVSQLRGLDAWHAARREAVRAAEAPGLSREARLDAARLLDVRDREHEVLLSRTSQVEDGDLPLLRVVPARAVIAHRHSWTRDALAKALRDQDVQVLEVLESGADAVAVCVCEQPALLVVDQVLAMRSGPEVAAEVRRLSPSTLVAGYVSDESAVAPLLEAGATDVCTRRVPPAVVAQRLAALL